MLLHPAPTVRRRVRRATYGLGAICLGLWALLSVRLDLLIGPLTTVCLVLMGVCLLSCLWLLATRD